MLQLSEIIPSAEFDYVLLKNLLQDYANPRNKISALIRSGQIIRVKKGLYIFNPLKFHRAVSNETLANLIYGPSCISLDYALAFYGLIPERVEVLTSVTTKPHKDFQTPLGRFSYRHVHPRRYFVGVELLALDELHTILIASKEKALADKLTITASSPDLATTQDLESFLSEYLRLHMARLVEFRLEILMLLAKAYRHKSVELLLELVTQMRMDLK